MDYEVRIVPLAKVEIANALEYYFEINAQLPQKFMKALYSSYECLKINPYYQKKYKNVHGLPLKNFPFLLFYTIDEENNRVEILSCFHTA